MEKIEKQPNKFKWKCQQEIIKILLTLVQTKLNQLQFT